MGIWLWLFGLSCFGYQKDLGHSPLDQAESSTRPDLKHLAEAYAVELPASAWTQRLPTPVYAPDPTELFASVLKEAKAAQPLSVPVSLSLLTFNVGLLSGKEHRYPYVEQREEALPDALFGLDVDVIFLQEVWSLSAADKLRSAAGLFGYVVYSGDRKSHDSHGLMTFVKADIIEYSTPIQQDLMGYQSRSLTSIFSGRKPATLVWSLVHRESGQSLLLLNTQAEKGLSQLHTRNRQARELGLHVRNRPKGTVALLGGDLQAGPYFLNDGHNLNNEKQTEGWWKQTTTYPLWLYYGGFRDVWNEVAIPKDVILGQQWGEGGYLNKLTNPVYCSAITEFYTIQDCNLVFRQAAGGFRYPARVDHLLIAGERSQVQVRSAKIIFNKPQSLPGSINVELGIHSAVWSELLLERME